MVGEFVVGATTLIFTVQILNGTHEQIFTNCFLQEQEISERESYGFSSTTVFLPLAYLFHNVPCSQNPLWYVTFFFTPTIPYRKRRE
jgi:hypothetical protein